MDLGLPCRDQSLQVGERIFGTATADVDAWLLIEHRGRWERDIESTALPAAARDYIAELERRHPQLRPQLIRRPPAEPGLSPQNEPLTVYLVHRGAIHARSIADHADLPSLDLAAVLGETPPPPNGPRELYLVCTHGRRDRCCALHGVALHKQLANATDNVWQCSHLGGHRFAPTMVYLPSGVHYGRLTPDDAAPLVACHARGRLYELRCYRGQTRYGRPAQMAEAWLREQEQELRFDGIELLGEAMDIDQRWTVRFRTADHQLHRIVVEPRTDPTPRRASCDAEELVVAHWYAVVRHEAQMVTPPR